jgi:uncharacterized protein
MSIPARIQASAAIAHGEKHVGELALKLLPRLAALLEGGEGRLRVELQATDAPGYPVLRGTVDGKLPLRCERCDQRFDWPLHAAPDLRLVFSEDEEKRALHDSEPYLVEHDALPLREIVEDEVLLALPMLARCESCENALRALPEQAATEEEPRREPSQGGPFAALKQQLKK